MKHEFVKLETKDTRSSVELVRKVMDTCQPIWVGVPAICYVTDLPPFKVFQALKNMRTYSYRYRGVPYYALRKRVREN